MLGRKRFELDTLKVTLEVEDFFSHDQSIIYSWDNKRLSDSRIMARLDRFYTFISNMGRPNNHIKNYKIDGSYSLIDHLPVYCDLVLKEEQPAGSRYKLNSAYLLEPSVLEEMKYLWNNLSSQMDFLGKLCKLIKWYRVMSITKAKKRREQEETLRKRLVDARGQLHSQPTCPVTQQEVNDIQEELKVFEC